ncbi:MAG: dihydroorotase [Candidatus Gracilibacteria bacterium]|nr:dihydroorotase [Candidatus Gracilibacteria bacterium]
MQIILNSPLDMHVHLRDNDMLKVVAPLTSKTFAGALVMPNLVPPIKTLEDVVSYKKRVLDETGNDIFTPYMTVFFSEELTFEILKQLKSEILSVKLYPEGVTTNSQGGAKNILSPRNLEIFANMETLGIPLSIHGETSDFVLDREKNFISIYEELATRFPKLKIIAEHITTKELAETLDKFENLYATITVHHLLITLNDLAGGMLKPHLFCKPIAKRDEDREALLKLALSGNSKVMLGTDSAPHPIHKKECSGCAAGVFTSPIALQLLTELFEENNSLNNLQKFISDNAVRIYNLKPNQKQIILEKKDFIIPEKYGEVVPFKAGENLKWSIIN